MQIDCRIVLVLVVYWMPCVNSRNRLDNRDNTIKIGVIMNERTSNYLLFAWNHFKLKNTEFHPIAGIDISNNHLLITTMCKKMKDGIYMMVVDNHPSSYSTVQSYAQNMHMPTLIPTGRGSSPIDEYHFDISLLPPTIDAIVDLIKHLYWNTVVYYIWDTNDGLLRLQKLYELLNDIPDDRRPVVRARRIYNVSDCYEMLRRIDHMDPPPKRIILDLSSRKAYMSVLEQIVDVGMNREGYHYILGGLGIDELELNTFKYGGVNITGFSILDKESSGNKDLINKRTIFEHHTLGEILTAEALIIDTVHVLSQTLEILREGPNIRPPKNRPSNNHYIGSSHHNCSGETVIPSFDGDIVLNIIKEKVKVYGLTGNVEFDEHGIRKNYVFRIFHLEHKKDLRNVGTWTPKGRLNTTLPKPDVKPPIVDPVNVTLDVTTIEEEPFVQTRKSMDKNGAPLVNGRYLEGYCIDLAKKVQETSFTPYEYKIHLVHDNAFGKSNKVNGTWDGMIGELINNMAHIAIAPLTITAERQRVVDFTKPFMQTGISIMIKKPDKEKPGVFSFMSPLSRMIWLCVMIAFVAVSLVLFLVGRWSPYEWTDDNTKGRSPINSFTFLNTLWFSLGALMQQGSDIFPRSVSGRIVGSAWWFFTLILISSYTANLAAFLTIERLTPPIKSVDDLVKQSEIEYGTLKTGSSRVFFESSKVSVYEQMWSFMKAHEDRVLMSNIRQGVDQVRRSKGKYAFLMESTFNMYFNQRKPCNTMMVGDNLDSKDYGIATPMGFYLRDQLNLAVLNLREVGELHKLKQKWWYAKGTCGTNSKDATTSALTLSNVSGIFHILVGGLVLAMLAALIDYFFKTRAKLAKQKRKNKQEKSPAVRIVKKQTLEALKEVGYSERENSPFLDYSTPMTASSAASPLVTFDSGSASFGMSGGASRFH